VKDRGKESVNKWLQYMLKKEGIQFQVRRNPNVKCAIFGAIARFAIICRYMTYKNTYRYIDVLPKFVKGYNDMVHTTTGIAPSKVTDSDILTMWNKMRATHSSIRRAPVKFEVSQHIRISKAQI
jgi:hypothetical protein